MSVCLYVTVFLFSDNPETTCSEILHHSVCGKSEGIVTPPPPPPNNNKQSRSRTRKVILEEKKL